MIHLEISITKFYFTAFDYTIQSIKAGLEQDDFKQYSVLEQLVFKSANGQN